MGQIVDMSGRTFGRLAVLELAGFNAAGAALWLCRCECGEPTIQRGSKLRRGEIVSCGCQRRDRDIKRAIRMLLPAARRAAIASAGGVARSSRTIES